MNILNSIKGKLTFDKPNPKISKTEESTVYDELKYVEKICEKAIHLSNTKAKKLHSLSHAKETLNGIDIYEKIDSETMSKVENLMKEYAELKKSKDALRSHITEYGKKFEHLSHFSHKDIEEAFAELSNLEKEELNIKKDLGHLRGEKEVILDTIDKLEKTSVFIRVLFHATLFVIALSLVAFVLIATIMREEIIIPASISAVVAIFWTLWIYLFSGHVSRELFKQRKLQAREIQLSNKVKVKFVNTTSLLDAKYRKYNTRSAESLKKEWDKYQETLDKKYEYNKIFHRYFDIEESLQEILSAKGIIFDEDIDMIEVISNIKDKLKVKTELENKIKTIENEIKIIESEKNKLEEKLSVLEANDKTEQKVIKTVINSYFSEVKEIL